MNSVQFSLGQRRNTIITNYEDCSGYVEREQTEKKTIIYEILEC